MLKNIISIRFQFIRSHLVAALVSTILFFVGLQLFFLFFPTQSIHIPTILWMTLFVTCISIGSGVFIGYRNSMSIKKRIEDVSTYITVLSRGNLSERIQSEEKDEIGRISDELNQLAIKIEGQVDSLQRLAEQKAELANNAHTVAVVEERQRLARDLHDAVSQQLFALSMLSSAAVRLIDDDPNLAKKQLQEIGDMAGQAQVEMRALLLHLRPVRLSGEPLDQAINQLVNELEQRCPIKFKVSIQNINDLSFAVEDHLFRIVQEALANSLRHADASKMKIDLYKRDQYIFLHVYDNGKGFDVTNLKMASYGLHTMKERCEEIGGQFSVKSNVGEGTYIDIRIPFKGGEHDGGEN
ncbi:sensor histidine kinase [Bacillus sp. SM2101]|uniref:HAMP domain-containing sensor histidine kinase n=1 Tax=Bacillaceae TaxID=186817 RepID=UPI001BDE9791|nr:sensor histidine kinase [Bacillus sp. SM2101]